MRLTFDEKAELDALVTLGGKSWLVVSWKKDPMHRRMVRKGIVRWGRTRNGMAEHIATKKGVAIAKPIYAAQIAVYQAYMDAAVPGLADNPALFTAINKDTAELHHELVPFDAALAQRMSDRAVRILQATDAGDLLPRIAQQAGHFECRMCPWAQRCWSLPG